MENDFRESVQKNDKIARYIKKIAIIKLQLFLEKLYLRYMGQVCLFVLRKKEET